ncbi:vWA domain-containing protein [Luteolibacter sp. AS25]|uniref:vWA domain-containing protein n=1 Tax=Luteolibacter sp. AS25 TaxID=3135776 RepID=UPI00398B1C58
MKTELAFILDRSISMESIRTAAINGFNQFLRDQQNSPGQTKLTLVYFDSIVEVRHLSLPVAEILPLDLESYVPQGSTSLLDAIGRTIDKTGQRLSKLPEADRPDHVSIAILTDGEENSSTKYTWADIAKRIKHQTEKYQWEFLFLGANADAIATAGRMNIQMSNAAAYVADDAGYEAAMTGMTRKSLASRAYKHGNATAEQLHDAAAPMNDIVREEDQRRR